MKKMIFTAFLLCLVLPSLALADGLILTSTSCTTNYAAISYSSSLPFTVGDADRTITDTCTSGTPAITTNDAAKCTIVGSAPYTLHAVGAGSCIAYNNCPSGSGYCTGVNSQTITVSAAASIALVGSPTGNNTYGSTVTVAPTATSNLAVGNMVVVFVGTNGGYGVTGVSDNATTPNTYTAAPSPGPSSTVNTNYVIKAYTSVITTAKSGAIITATTGAGSESRMILVYVISGLTSNLVDKVAVGSMSATNLTASGTISTSAANEFLVAAWINASSSTPTIASPWTAGPTITAFYSEYQIVSSTGTYQAAATFAYSPNAVILLGLK